MKSLKLLLSAAAPLSDSLLLAVLSRFKSIDADVRLIQGLPLRARCYHIALNDRRNQGMDSPRRRLLQLCCRRKTI